MTKALIGMTTDNSGIISIEITGNGSPRQAGHILQTYYADTQTILDLLLKGDAQNIGKTPERITGKTKNEYDNRNHPLYTIQAKDDEWNAFHADRDQTMFLVRAHENDDDYAYLYKSGEWHTHEREDMIQAVHDYGTTIGIPDLAKAAEDKDTRIKLAKNVADHHGNQTDYVNIVTLRQTTGVTGINYALYKHLQNQIPDLMKHVRHVIDDNNIEERTLIMSEILRWHKAKAWHKGMIYGFSESSEKFNGENADGHVPPKYRREVAEQVMDDDDNPYISTRKR